MNRAVHAAAAEQAAVSRVHDRIDIQLGDVATDNVDLAGGRHFV
jgi:hypothetical protein